MEITEREARERFGTWLRNSRENMGLTLRDVAKMVDLSYQSILYYETGERFPDLVTIAGLAQIFNVPPWYPIYVALTPIAETLPPDDINVMDDDAILLYHLIVGMPKDERDRMLAQVRAVAKHIGTGHSQRGTSEEAGPE